MNQLIWIFLLLTMMVWTSKCDQQMEILKSNPANQTSLDVGSLDYVVQSEDNANDVYNGIPNNNELSEDDAELESNLAESDEIDQSASSNIESAENNTANHSSISNLVNNNPALQAHIEHLKKTNPQLLKYASNNEKQFFDTIFRNFINSQNNNNNNNSESASSKDADKYKELLPKLDPTHEDNKGKIYTIGDLRKYYEQTRNESPRQRDESPTNQPSYTNYYNPNHNYLSTNDEWKPLINTKSNQASANYYENGYEHGPSTRVVTYIANDIPSSLSNFYVASGQNPFHAYESNQNQISNNQQQEIKESQIPKVISAKDIMASHSNGKDSSHSNKITDKMSSHVAYKESGYVPVEHDDRFNQYLTCCEQLFKNYGNKDYVHEDVYLLPKGEDYPLINSRQPGYMTHNHHHGYNKPVSYFRGYPIVTQEDKENLHREPYQVVKHAGVECSDDNHHHHRHHHHNQYPVNRAGHYMPSYHSTTHIRPPISRHSVATLLLKKKLALLGKRYLLG